MKKNKLALVTGSTAGIGFAIAEGLLQKKMDVIINGRSEERVNKAINKLIENGAPKSSLHGVAADLSTTQGISKVLELFPDVDVLVNNFGIFEPKDFADISDNDWDKMWTANFMSGVRLSRHYFPRMIKNNEGRVLFISSESGVQVPMEMIHYGVSKSAQIALARGLAEAAANTKVTVNSVLVGPTRSEGVETFLKQLGEKMKMTGSEVENAFFKTARATSLLQRFIRPEEVAAAVSFLSSDEASAITGSAMRVDGGVIKAMI